MSFLRETKTISSSHQRTSAPTLSNRPLANQPTEGIPELLLEAKVVPAGQREVSLHVSAAHRPAPHKPAGQLEHVGVRRIIPVRGNKVPGNRKSHEGELFCLHS